MQPSQSKPWSSRWVEVNNGHLGSGGQGNTSLVHSMDNTRQFFVLKKLKQNKDAERRKRMHREASILQTLECNGVPRYIDGNTDKFADTDPLFLVLEYIEGPTLDQHVNSAPLGVDEAIDMLESLLETLDYCHSRGIIHRDIKPNNIVLRNGDIRKPTLIDFGISFNSEAKEDPLETKSAQQLVNRFLHLPELGTAESDKRDLRTDLTAVVALVLYAISGRNPQTLLDENNRKPHQRPDAINTLSSLPEPQKSILRRMFDRAFEIPIDQRWQSISEIRQMIARERTVVGDNIADMENSLNALKERFESDPEIDKRKRIAKYFESIKGICFRAMQNRASKLGHDYSVIQSQGSIDWTTYTQDFNYRIGHRVKNDPISKSKYRVRSTSVEIILEATYTQNEWEEIFRAGLMVNFDGDELTQAVSNYILKDLNRAFNDA